MLPISIIAAIAPAAIDAVKTLFGGLARKVGGLSVDDEIKLLNANVDKLKALAGLDNPVGTPSQWVVDLRASFRYIGAGISMAIGGLVIFYAPADIKPLGIDLISAPFSFIFGERLYMGLKGIAK